MEIASTVSSIELVVNRVAFSVVSIYQEGTHASGRFDLNLYLAVIRSEEPQSVVIHTRMRHLELPEAQCRMLRFNSIDDMFDVPHGVMA